MPHHHKSDPSGPPQQDDAPPAGGAQLSTADAGSLGTASAGTPSAGAAAEADAHAHAVAVGPGGDAAGFAFSISEVQLPDHAASATGLGIGFAEAGDFSKAALGHFMDVAQHAVGEIMHGLEHLLESGAHHPGGGSAHAEGLGLAGSSVGGALSASDAHAAAGAAGPGAEAAGFSFSISEAELSGKDGMALSEALGFAGAGNFTDAELAEFMKIAQHAIAEIADGLGDLLDSNDGSQSGHRGGSDHDRGEHGHNGGQCGGHHEHGHRDRGDRPDDDGGHDAGHPAHIPQQDHSCWHHAC